MSEGGADAAAIFERRRRTIGIAISAVLVLIAIVLVVQGDGEDEPQAVDTTAHLVELDEIAAVEDSLGHPLYWAGERPPDRLELRQEPEGSVYLRYLPPGVEAGDPEAGFLTVGTYPVADAAGALQSLAAENKLSLESAPGGAKVLVNSSSQGSVYLAYPDSDLQIEVYDPAPGRALELIRAGEIRPAG